MIGYVGMEEQVDADFTRALRRSFVHRLGARLRGDSSHRLAPSFHVAARVSGARNRRRLGRRVVAVEEIVGSVGRSWDFDRDFLPVRRDLEEKWKQVDRAFHRGVDLPPVELNELGGSYFVVDGNHRVSVARYQGVRWIEAEVTRLYAGTTAASEPARIHRKAEGHEETALPAAA
jgi:hypothetical protein